MAFDPTKPAANSPIVSAELRDQFNGLKALIDALAVRVANLEATVGPLDGRVATLESQMTTRAPRVDGVSDALLAVNDPPQQAEVVAIAEKLVELIDALQQP
jgi:hypothetical protein